MNNTMEKQLMVLPDVCDSEGRMSLAGAATLFMNLATEHAEELGIGITALKPKNMFWLTVRTKIRILNKPALAEYITAKTWPEAPERFRSVRDYIIMNNGEPVVLAKTEWAVLNTVSGRLEKAAALFLPGFGFCEDRSLPDAFATVKDDFTEEPFAERTVLSADIDMGGHMNNAAYIRMLTGLFTLEEWKGLGFTEMDVQFRSQCFEGDTLLWQRRTREGATELRAAANGKTVFLASLR